MCAMMDESGKPTHEQIREIQEQLKTAIQNHHLLVLRRRQKPEDANISHHINMMQGTILSLGRLQTEMLVQFQQEMVAQNEKNLSKYLCWAVPKHIALFKKGTRSYKQKMKESALAKQMNKKMSAVLKPSSVSNGATTKVPSGRPKVSLKQLGKATEVYLSNGSKRVKVESGDNSDEDTKKTSGGSEDSDSTDLPASKCEPPSSGSSRSTSPTTLSFASKIRRHLADLHNSSMSISSRTRLKIATKRECREDHSFKESLFDNSPMIDDTSLNFNSLDEAGQEFYLGYLGLVNTARFESLKRKKLERKRRSVAGQSSMYNDYLQPPSVSSKKAERALLKTTEKKRAALDEVVEEGDEEEAEGDEVPWQQLPPPTVSATAPVEEESAPGDSESRVNTITLIEEDEDPSTTQGELQEEDDDIGEKDLDDEGPRASSPPPTSPPPPSQTTEPNRLSEAKSEPEPEPEPEPEANLSGELTEDQSSSSQVVVETARELEDEELDEKPAQRDTCAVCSLSDEGDGLEVCSTCSITYHSRCRGKTTQDCPTCSIPLNIKNIVGANCTQTASSASSSEIIKRYRLASPPFQPESKGEESGSNEVEIKIEEVCEDDETMETEAALPDQLAMDQMMA